MSAHLSPHCRVVITGDCPQCGKARFPSERQARRAMRMLYPQEKGRIGAYRCGQFWHIGRGPATGWTDVKEEG